MRNQLVPIVLPRFKLHQSFRLFNLIWEDFPGFWASISDSFCPMMDSSCFHYFPAPIIS